MKINSNGNVYEQIVSYYRTYISLGIIEPDEKMPSSRELAINLGVNPKTVEKAYAILVEEGLIYTIPKKGYFVKGKEDNKEDKMILEFILNLKSKGVSKDKIQSALDKVFGGEYNDTNK